jgi:N-glycosylase/DNA lyase
LLRRIDLKGEPLDLDFTFESGQIFQWRKVDEWWLGQVGLHAVLLKTDGGSLIFRAESGLLEDELRRFLRLDTRNDETVEGRAVDEFSHSLLMRYRGLRLLRQEPWACLVAYMVSASLSIKAIDKVLGSIASPARELEVAGRSVHAFPGPQEFLGMRRPRRGYLGRKWGYLRRAAKSIVDGRLDLNDLRALSYEDAWRALVVNEQNHILGVGPKVADCVLLFSLDKPEAFPMDRWILRGVQRHYGFLVPERTALKLKRKGEVLTRREYEAISGSARSYFGDLGGLIQECLFLHMRTETPMRPSA